MHHVPGFVWQAYDSQTFIGAEVFALINFVILLLFAVMLVVLQTGVSEQLGIGEGRRTCIAWLPLRPEAALVPPVARGYVLHKPNVDACDPHVLQLPC